MAPDPDPRLADAGPLAADLDHAADMVAGMHRFLDAETASAAARRTGHSTLDADVLRASLRRMLGVVDDRLPSRFETITPVGSAGAVGAGDGYSIVEVRWPVLRNVTGAGLLCLPDGAPAGTSSFSPTATRRPRPRSASTARRTVSPRCARRSRGRGAAFSCHAW